jgi:hypothetical protein
VVALAAYLEAFPVGQPSEAYLAVAFLVLVSLVELGLAGLSLALTLVGVL